MAEELHFDNPAGAAADPSTDAESLRQLAYRYPELRATVAAHPNAYRGLLDWLHQFDDPTINAALEARDDYDGYIDSNGYLVMHGDVSGAVAGSSIRTSESGMYVLGQGGVNSYSQVERTTPYSAVVGTNASVPQVEAHEQVVAQVQRQSIFGGASSGDDSATQVYPGMGAGAGTAEAATQVYPTPQGPRPTPQAYPSAGAAYQVQPTSVQPSSAPTQGYGQGNHNQPNQEQAGQTPRRGLSTTAIVLIILAIVATVLLAAVIYVFTRGYEGSTPAASPSTSAAPAAPSTTATPSPSPSSSSAEPDRYPAPAGALSVSSFSSPSGNISCSFTESAVSCGIDESDWAEDGFASCPDGQTGTLTVTRDGASQSCSTNGPGGGNALNYGAAAAGGDYACHSTQDGVSCWNTKTGRSFALARGGWMTGTGGEIQPNQFTWNQ